jgi:Pyruvate/2-oxoacid:ferredoxin oxidoreductase gamma subunit
MEREVILTGIGGQGVQLAAQVLARAALLEGREVLLLGTYGGTMRGGSTDATVVVADRTVESPPVVARAGAAVALHHQFFGPVAAKLRPGALVVVNESLFRGALDPGWTAVPVAATQLAAELGAPLAASMVLLGAYAAASELVGLEALVEGMRASVPSYRTQHLEDNERALRAGHAAAPAGVAPAWAEEAA